IDLVVAIADPALQFALDHRDELFPGAPIVYSGLAIPATIDRGEFGGVTGVLRSVAYAQTLKLALALHPSTEQAFVSAKTADQQAFATIQAALKEAAPTVRLNYLDADTVASLVDAARRIPPRSLVLYIWYRPDDRTLAVPTIEAARLIAEASPVPVYGT